MNYDPLVTYLFHPGTALYVGYNSNLQNLDPSLSVLPSGNLARTRSQFINDSRQFFVKFSYLFRFKHSPSLVIPSSLGRALSS